MTDRNPFSSRRKTLGITTIAFAVAFNIPYAVLSMIFEYPARSIPTRIVFKKGKVLAQRAGAMDAATLRSWLREDTAEFA